MATKMLFCSRLLIALGLMVSGGMALSIDFTIDSTTLYDLELTCSAKCNGSNCSSISAISSIDVVEVNETTERRIATLNSVLRQPISLSKGVVTKMDGKLSGKEGFVKISVKADENVLRYACRAAFYDNKFDVVTVEKEQDNKANVLMTMLNQYFAKHSSGMDCDATLHGIEKKVTETFDSVSELSVAVAEVQEKLDAKSTPVTTTTRAPEMQGLFIMLEDMALVLSKIFQKVNRLPEEAKQTTTENPACAAPKLSCNAFRGGSTPAPSALMPITLPDSSPVLCDTVTDGGGWTIFQRRVKGDVGFYRNWTSYEEGFGSISTDYWLGLKTLSSLMDDGPQELRVDIEYRGKRYYAKYSSFSVGGADTNYKLHVSGYSGTAGDSLEYHNGMAFSTLDRDNDAHTVHCAPISLGAWWYKACQYSNLNGEWKSIKANKGLRWRATTGSQSATFSEMKTRRVQ